MEKLMQVRFNAFVLFLCVGAVFAFAGGCAAQATPPKTGDPERTQFGRLDLAGVNQRLEDNSMHLDVTVANPFAEAVSGVRVLYRILVTPDPDTKEITRSQEVFETTLEPGEKKTVTLTLPPQAGQRGNFGTFLHAYAVRRGSEALPLPPKWRADSN